MNKELIVKFTLIENALDSIALGLEYFYQAKEKGTPREYKHCLINMFHGAELILKELLRKIDIKLVFDKNSLYKVCKDPLSPTDEELYKLKSIDMSSLYDEILKYYPNDFKGKLNIVKILAKERNKVQHFALEINSDVLSKLLANLYTDVFKTAFKIILLDLGYINPYVCSLTKEIMDAEEKFLNIHGDSDNSIAMCPNCESYSHFILFKGTGHPVDTYCIVCDYKNIDIDICDFLICPECGWPSLIYNEDYSAGVCLNEKCYYGNQGGFVEMKPCNECNGFIIEGACPTCDDDE
ncbi:hypothetical protein NTP67_07725 [Providencia rettgeri]|uniref:hypothetical protein n=1 Tax=Providencia rettgeri TaxID=587 RepID=UPI0022211107|nr:hypothetical protein [Providencia rettgeri]ELR5278980.1 hypothetical protein [Providencia rettgeri]UYV43126.1 hypothetical protein NTP67_07725 [Providencia rettgeri]